MAVVVAAAQVAQVQTHRPVAQAQVASRTSWSPQIRFSCSVVEAVEPTAERVASSAEETVERTAVEVDQRALRTPAVVVVVAVV